MNDNFIAKKFYYEILKMHDKEINASTIIKLFLHPKQFMCIILDKNKYKKLICYY
jgi:hypothetical protein